jgi:hypothetical protein
MSETLKGTLKIGDKEFEIDIENNFITAGLSIEMGQELKKAIFETKKPQYKLEWRDITPKEPYEWRELDGECLTLNTLRWQRDYRLVQFKLTHEGEQVYKSIIVGEYVTFTSYSSPRTDTHISTFRIDYLPSLKTDCYVILSLHDDSYNNWSVPIVIPIAFYNKLDEYVAEFNMRLNE